MSPSILCTGNTKLFRYGFKHVVIPSDIFHAHPEIWPFSAPFAGYHAGAARPLPLPLFIQSESEPEPQEGKHLKIDAIFVYNDPRDMGLDTQLVIDLLLSHRGFLGTRSKNNGQKNLPSHGYASDSQPPLYFANPDIFWAGQYPLPRLGSGAFRASIQGLWREITGGSDLGSNLITGGKPSSWTYRFADARLSEQWSHLHANPSVGDRLERMYVATLPRLFTSHRRFLSDLKLFNDHTLTTATDIWLVIT